MGKRARATSSGTTVETQGAISTCPAWSSEYHLPKQHLTMIQSQRNLRTYLPSNIYRTNNSYVTIKINKGIPWQYM